MVYHLWKPKLWKVRKWIFLVGQQNFSIGCYVSYFATFIIVTISCSLNNCSHEQKNEKLWNLLRETLQSRNGRPWLLPSPSTTSLKIFFILIFSFKISSLGLKDFIFSFLSYFGKFLLFFFCFVFILHHFFLSLIFRFSFIVCFRRFYFLFCSILMRNIFYHIAFLTRHIRVIKSAPIFLLQQPGIIARNFWRQEVSAN